jgi:hypothetical protein
MWRGNVIGIVAVCVVGVLGCGGGDAAPYPQSQVISEIRFDWSTHRRLAPGSDNWPVTWADDNHQYTSWGDGGGFGGSNEDSRVSLGVARVEGDATSYAGFNVWGGKNPQSPATFGGKSYGILCVAGVLYMWVSPGSGAANYSEARLYKSTDYGASWTAANWTFVKDDGVILPTFLQFGQDHREARDDFLYVYANYFTKPTVPGVKDDLRVQKPGEIALMRVPKDRIMDRSAYEFFAGVNSASSPIWTDDIGRRRPVFTDPNGVGWNTSVSYNPGIGRYLLATEHTETYKGNLGIFDAPEPWGPWTSVTYITSFGNPRIEPTTFFWNFANKWLSADGRSFVLIFTGGGSNDSWNTVRGTLSIHRKGRSEG